MSRENGWPVVYEASDGRVFVDDVPVIHGADIAHIDCIRSAISVDAPGPTVWSVVVTSKPSESSHVSTVTVVTINDLGREAAEQIARTIREAAYNQAPGW